MPSVEVNGVDLYYEIHGREVCGGEVRLEDAPRADLAEAAPVLLLHGLGSSGRDWRFQVPALVARGPVIAIDLRGHGRSPRGRGRLTVERMADDVEALLGALKQPPAHVVGLSLGGCVGLALAIQAPARVRSLTLVNAFARPAPAGLRGAVRLLGRLGLLVAAPMRVVAAHVARDMFPGPDQEPLYRSAVESLSRNGKRTYAAALGALVRFDVGRRLAAVRCPTLVVAGDRDRAVPMTAKQRLARDIPTARVLVVPDSGHATNIDQAEAFNRELLDFISRH